MKAVASSYPNFQPPSPSPVGFSILPYYLPTATVIEFAIKRGSTFLSGEKTQHISTFLWDNISSRDFFILQPTSARRAGIRLLRVTSILISRGICCTYNLPDYSRLRCVALRCDAIRNCEHRANNESRRTAP